VWYRVIIVSALTPSLRDKDRLRDRESLTKVYKSTLQYICIELMLKYLISFTDRTEAYVLPLLDLVS